MSSTGSGNQPSVWAPLARYLVRVRVRVRVQIRVRVQVRVRVRVRGRVRVTIPEHAGRVVGDRHDRQPLDALLQQQLRLRVLLQLLELADVLLLRLDRQPRPEQIGRVRRLRGSITSDHIKDYEGIKMSTCVRWVWGAGGGK